MKTKQAEKYDAALVCLERPGAGSTKNSRRTNTRKAPRIHKATPKKILHFLSTQPTASPFDINMAIDSGYDVIVPHINVGVKETRALVQDAIFSRPPEYSQFTGLFIGGKDALLALDMLAEAKRALVPPFKLNAFADPGGSFTTAAAMIALVERAYRIRTGKSLKGARISVFGATGVVGFVSAVISALEGAKVTVVTHMGFDAIGPLVEQARARFGVRLKPALGAREFDKTKLLEDADIVLCAAAAGVRVLEARHFKRARTNAVVADVNAVSPSGIEGINLFDCGTERLPQGGYGIGPLAIGDVKYKTQSMLLQSMTCSNTEAMYDFRSAFGIARQIASRASD